jgi:hypothetical protein
MNDDCDEAFGNWRLNCLRPMDHWDHWDVGPQTP